MQRRRIVVAAAMVTAAGAAVAFTLPSNASTTPSSRAGASPAKAAHVAPAMLAAIQRDLGLDADQARAQIARQLWAAKVSTKLSQDAGAAWAGAWLAADGTTLNVAVTDSALSEPIRSAGAQPKIVENSSRQLNSVKASLDSAATQDNQGLPGWYVDVASNRVVLLAHPGETAAARRLAAQAGVPAGTVTVKTTREKPRTLANERGGDPYFITLDGQAARCSIGFAVVGGFVTAGHCGAKGTETNDFNQQAQGVVTAAIFPGAADFGVVKTDKGETPSAVINDFQGNELPIAGSQEAPVGAVACRSGSTSGLHCGKILAKNESVTYPEGTVTGLIRTSICAEGGDSGGPMFAGDQAQGVTSGGSGDCTTGGETFFQPIIEILQRNNLTLLTTANDGGAGVAGDNGAGASGNGVAGAGDNGAGSGGSGNGFFSRLRHRGLN